MSLETLREQVWKANQGLVSAGLVTLSFGNASGIDRASASRPQDQGAPRLSG
jgi:ribulose-5-phosphate 4-epimerase/fuculose-1-phosphate aldolase